MEFKREILEDLKAWKSKTKRKPLLLLGARQIGKTTILKSFGRQEYVDLAYFNLEKDLNIHDFFKQNKNPQSILNSLSLVIGRPIEALNTLVVLDEIQECKDALISLKYFQEELPHINIIGAGSLLGLSIGNDRAFPVGKVEFLDMYPLSFSEYLQYADPKSHKAFHHFLSLETINQIPSAFFDPFLKLFKEYLLIAGMPEVAAHFLEHRDILSAQNLQDQIIRAYKLDFVKHAHKTTATKIQHIWNSLPSQLAKENKKFIYKVIKSGARARAYEEAIEWLAQAGLIYKISKIEKIGKPLKAYEDITAFKIYMFETGLLIRVADLEPTTFMNGDQFFTEFKGSIAENYVAQSLTKVYKKVPYYWASEGKAEVDFLINHKGETVPIEVKSGTKTKAKSLAVYKKKHKPKLRIRVSNLNLNITDDLLNIPLFYAEYIDQFIQKVMS